MLNDQPKPIDPSERARLIRVAGKAYDNATAALAVEALSLLQTVPKQQMYQVMTAAGLYGDKADDVLARLKRAAARREATARKLDEAISIPISTEGYSNA